MCRGVQRCEGVAQTQLFNHVVGDKAALKEVRTAVDDSVTYSAYLGNVRDASALGVGKLCYDCLDCS